MEASPGSRKGTVRKGRRLLLLGVRLGAHLRYGPTPKFADARAAFAQGSKLRVLTSCDWIEHVDRDEKAYRDELESLWLDLRDAANEVAHKRYLHACATTKLPQTAQNVKGATNIQAHLKVIISEQFCPAKKKYLLEEHRGGLFGAREAALQRQSPSRHRPRRDAGDADDRMQ